MEELNGEKPSLLNKQELIQDLISPTSSGKRFLNYLIDTIFHLGLAMLIFAIPGLIQTFFMNDNSYFIWLENLDSLLDRIISTLLGICFYIIFEFSFGKTLGKMITKTRVVMNDGTKPSLITIIKRSFCRIIPFNQFSLLGSNPIGWHDKYSDTLVIDDIPFYNLQERSKAFDEEEETY